MNIKNCARGFTGLRIAWCATWFDMNVWDSICWMYRVIFLGYILQSLPYILGISRQVIPIRRDKKVNQKRQKSKQYIIHTFLKTVC